MLQAIGNPDNKLLVFDKILGQEPVQQVDAALVIHFLARDIRAADAVVDRRAGTANRTRHELSRTDLGDVRPNGFHSPEHFVAQDKKLEPGRRIAVFRLVDLFVGGVHADFQDFDQDTSSPLDIVKRRFG